MNPTPTKKKPPLSALLPHAAFCAGLAVLAYVGVGYLGQPLALAVTALIAAFFVMGALELQRFHGATQGLARALAALPADNAPPALGPWLDTQVPAALRAAVRGRIEGERTALPGPALAPTLAGLLVLLGMLGTFLGMVITLQGTGLALDAAADLPAIRASLAAPVKGLGLAFGTSVAGVAASAMLGLMSAWRRRERLQVAQALEARLATSLRAFSPVHQREQSLALLQRQSEAMPQLVEQVQALMARLAQQNEALNERLLAQHEAFFGRAESAYAGLAASVDKTLTHSLAEGARLAGAAIQPAVEATLAGLAREASALHAQVGEAAQAQVNGAREALAGLRPAVEATLAGLAREAAATQARVAEAAQHQVDALATRLDAGAASAAAHHEAALARHQQASAALAAGLRDALQAHAAAFEQRAAALADHVARSHADTQTAAAARDEERFAAWAHELAAMTASLQQAWQHAGEQAQAQQQRVCDALEDTAREIASQSRAQVSEVIAQTRAQSREVAEQAQAQAREVVAQTQAQARETIAEVRRLAEAAVEAPRAAAEAMAELRQRLAESTARDNALLDERARVLGTLDTLLGAVNHAATEQRQAIDALVGTSAELLDRVGGRFAEQVQAHAGALEGAAAQVAGGAVEVASLGEAFGHAVALFGATSDKLVAQLERIEGALARSMTRSDEQLAYYVAQAREVIDLSLMSQKQVIDDLQQISAARSQPVREAAASEA